MVKLGGLLVCTAQCIYFFIITLFLFIPALLWHCWCGVTFCWHHHHLSGL